MKIINFKKLSIILILLLNIISYNLFYSDNTSIEFIKKSKINFGKNENGTFLYFLDIIKCYGCSSTIYEKIINQSIINNKDKEHIIIIKNLQESEAVAFSNKYLTKKIIADEDGELCNYFKVDNFPFYLHIDKNGKIIAKKSINEDKIKIKKENKKIIFQDYIKLYEDKATIIQATNIILHKKNNAIYLLDETQNAIFIFNISNGMLIKKLIPNDKIKYHFISNENDSVLKGQFDIFAQPIIENIIYNNISNIIYAIIQNYSDTLIIKYDNDIKEHDTLLTLLPHIIIAEIKNYEFTNMNTLVKGNYTLVGSICSINGNLILESENTATDPDTNTLNNDSIGVFYLISDNFKNIKTLLYLNSIELLTSHKYDFNYLGLFCKSSDYRIYYLNPHNNVFISFNLNNKNIDELKIIKPKSELHKVISSYMDNNYYSNISSSFKVFNMLAINDYLFIYLQKKDTQKYIDEMLIQIYKNNIFIKEICCSNKHLSDKLINSHLIDNINDELIFLNKWEKNRWKIQKINLGDMIN